MGNCTSSCFIQVSDMAKVIDAQGKLKKVKLPVKAAEIMLDEPGRVISPVEELKRTRCVVPMRADDELLAAKAYVLVPIQRKLLVAERKRAKSGAKVLPELREEERQVDPVLAVPGCRKGNYRPWTPVLEPISEVL
ncbi:hypothetical protein E1A91_D07G146300v1 [Gossypium mustelinum]|uniref:Uncharacterized protein n=1 Tax=Gossypium mustelinum TaxID=34275 RepID=A0A5D2UA96_GOSMU|nr:hypothetical protein E1A91_D07G146300v1 [Gossypium mustelinum]